MILGPFFCADLLTILFSKFLFEFLYIEGFLWGILPWDWGKLSCAVIFFYEATPILLILVPPVVLICYFKSSTYLYFYLRSLLVLYKVLVRFFSFYEVLLPLFWPSSKLLSLFLSYWFSRNKMEFLSFNELSFCYKLDIPCWFLQLKKNYIRIMSLLFCSYSSMALNRFVY